MSSFFPSSTAGATSLLSLEWCRSLPKAELHCHIGGCVRTSTLEELLPIDTRAAARLALESTTLAGAFDIFKYVHVAICTEAALARVVREALEDAAADGVEYIELRSTPRPLNGVGDASARALEIPSLMGIEQQDLPLHRYVAVVGAAIVDAAKAMPHLICRLLISLDRSASGDMQASCARVATVWNCENIFGLAPFPSATSRLVVGVDVSGDPRKGDIRTLLSTLDDLRNRGLKISIHLGEIKGEVADAETAAVIKWKPDRIGHLAIVETLGLAALSTLGIDAPPVEVCPTSNALTLSLDTLDSHPTLGERIFDTFSRIAICTDDPSIFKTSLSLEYLRVAHAFGLNCKDISKLSAASFDFAFAEPTIMAIVKSRAIDRIVVGIECTKKIDSNDSKNGVLELVV
jgi:adenosine deaminase